MSDFKAKMHKIRFQLGLCLRPRCGSSQRSPDPVAVFKGPTSKGRDGQEEGRVRGEKGQGDERGRREEREGAGPQTFWPRTAPIWIGSSADERCQKPPGSGLSSRFD